MIDLLKQWTELQPDWCKRETGFYRLGNFVHGGRIYSIFPENLSELDLAALQAILQQAIASHNARLRLENSSEGWHATVAKPGKDASSIEILVFAKANEPALAVLEAWVQFLQQESSH